MIEETTHHGLVVRTTGSWYRVLQPDGTVVDCRLRGNFRLHGNKQTNPVAVGDHVDFTLLDDGTGFISHVDDRRNCIIRKSTKLSKQTHVIAANIDLLCVVASFGFPNTSTGFIDRLLVTAEAYHIPAMILFNKCDLYTDEMRQVIDDIRAVYQQVGYCVLETSAVSGQGIDKLRQLAAGKTILFSGHSGVGKSALLNAIDPSLHLRVGDVSEWSLKGKHTTTFAEIFPLQLGDGLRSYLIDTPGIKEFGMVDFTPEELSRFFPEMRVRLHDCHFANCTHRHEPGCAIKQAVEEGHVPASRYKNYLKMIEDIS